MSMGAKHERIWEIIQANVDDPAILLEAGNIVSDLRTESGVLHGSLRGTLSVLPDHMREKIERLLEKYPL
jgi:hypothetical protein